MKPIITVEFTANTGDESFKEESVPLHSPEELLSFVAPGGGCETIPDDVVEIKMVFLPPGHRNQQNSVADLNGNLQLGMVFFSGPLAEIIQAAQMIVDKAGRGELSDAFKKVIGASD